MQEIAERIGKIGLVPVLVVDDAARAAPLAQTLDQAGLQMAEVTFRTPAAGEVIRRMAQAAPDLLMGAGTVLSVEDAARAVEGGARFVVSPGFDPQIVQWCLEHQVLIAPGVATPTDITLALRMGLKVLKFFPAEILGGVKALKAMASPFGEVRFIPSGGVGPNNAVDYLRLSSVLAVSGTWFAKRDLINKGAFDEIGERTRAALALVEEARLSS